MVGELGPDRRSGEEQRSGDERRGPGQVSPRRPGHMDRRTGWQRRRKERRVASRTY